MTDRLIRQREYAQKVGVAFDTVTRQVQQGRCDVSPAAIRPYRWRLSEVERFIGTTSLVAARQARARKLRSVAAAAVALLMLAVPLAAQQVGPVVDKQGLHLEGWSFWPMEFDGDPQTREWLGLQGDPEGTVLHRVVAQRDWRLCVGEPFDPWALLRPSPEPFTVLAWVRIGGVDALVAQGVRYYREFRFEVPSC